MSFERVKSISITEEGIFITSSCNNDDVGMRRWKFNGNLGSLFYNMLGGSLQVSLSTNNGTWAYRLKRIQEILGADYRERGLVNAESLLEPAKQVLSEKIPRGKFYLQSKNGHVITRHKNGVTRLSYTWDSAKGFNYYKAKYLSYRYGYTMMTESEYKQIGNQ